MVGVHLYVEGGGDHDKALKTRCQEGFSRFLAKQLHPKPRIIACGGREQAFDRFCSALRINRDTTNLLLVDSEAPVMEGHGPWEHLAHQARWTRPALAADDHAHLMVQCMEAWFLSDLATLARFGPFERGFKPAKIPLWPSLENVPKATLLSVLDDATRDCRRPYRKGELSFKLLGEIDPALVRQASPHAERLFVALLHLLG